MESIENYSFLLGFIPGEMFAYMVFFAAVGIAIALLADSTRRNPESKSTPTKFSTWFLIKDNWKTILLTVLVVLGTLRFAGSLFPGQFIDAELSSPLGTEKWLFGSMTIGILYNTLLQRLKEKAEILKVKRD